MSAIKAVVRNGKIELEAPEGWPEGTEVLVELLPQPASRGLGDEEWPDTPEGIARHLELMDGIEPLDFTSEEEAEWKAARIARKDFDKKHFDKQAETFRGCWE